MKKFICLVAALVAACSIVLAADIAQPTPGGVIISDFEEFSGAVEKPKVDNPPQGPFVWWIYNDADAGKTSTIRGDIVNDAAHGSKALQITWTLDGWCGLGWKPIDPKINWDWSNYNALSMWVKGDGTKMRYVIELDDVNKEVFWSTVVKVDKAEWTKVVIPFKQIRPRGDWQPSDAKRNTVIDWPVQIQFTPQCPKGTVIIDCLEVIP